MLSTLRSVSPLVSVARMFSSASELLRKEVLHDNQVVRIILNAPKQRNALSLDMINALHKELVEADSVDEFRAVILAADGPAFSSGHNLRELRSSEGMEKHRLIFEKCANMVTYVQSMSLPVIAEVNGIAAAAGCQLVASCDIVVAGKSSTFCTPGVKAGLFCHTPGIAVARTVPRKVALDMLFTADSIDAETALRAGLVSRVVDDSKVQEEALNVARKVASLSRSVIALGKAFFYSQVELPTLDAYRMGERIMVENLRYVDAQEGIAAFIEKRKANWTHSDKKTN
ncbi:hypothetical protein AB6A40_002017 [Gnathostoma spinigerum]|uniref:Enoyl-CoA hydratase domain-containing protein 3, mitochondrial n=1 Tax=Gnathostoma spinigerum TaxID=75299 RepID=A0ABD6E5K3_9BILA